MKGRPLVDAMHAVSSSILNAITYCIDRHIYIYIDPRSTYSKILWCVLRATEKECGKSVVSVTELHHSIAQESYVLIQSMQNKIRTSCKHVFHHSLGARSTLPTFAQITTWIFGTRVLTMTAIFFVHTFSTTATEIFGRAHVRDRRADSWRVR
jgi:hypothetical protein